MDQGSDQAAAPERKAKLGNCKLWAHACALMMLCPAPSFANGAVVAVDAGHTLSAPGARGAVDGMTEREFNQSLAKQIQIRLGERGARAQPTNFPEMEKENFKARGAKAKGADLLMSVHHDSAKAELLTPVAGANGAPERYEDKAGRFKGYSIFIDKRDPRALACARAIGARMEAAGEEPSSYHHDAAMGEKRELVDARYGIHNFPELMIIKTSQAKSTLLVEAGVIVNPDESLRLRSALTQRRLANAMADGALDCLAPGAQAPRAKGI